MSHPLLAITGATGFLGGRLLERLKARYALRILARKPESVHFGSQVEIISGDLSQRECLQRLCKGAFGVVHCAGAIKAPTRAAFAATNVEGTLNVVQAAREAHVSRFILISSLAAQEPQISNYSWSKREAERVAFEESGTMDLIALRPPAIYGPGDHATLTLFKQLISPLAFLPVSQKQKLSLIHVDDVISAIVFILENGVDNSLDGASFYPKIFSIDDQWGKEAKQGYSWAELCAIASHTVGYRVRPVFLPRFLVAMAAQVLRAYTLIKGGVPLVSPDKVGELYHERWACQSPHLWEKTNFRPTFSFERGFQETLLWYRTQGWL